jgi:hypothetical protein
MVKEYPTEPMFIIYIGTEAYAKMMSELQGEL